MGLGWGSGALPPPAALTDPTESGQTNPTPSTSALDSCKETVGGENANIANLPDVKHSSIIFITV